MERASLQGLQLLAAHLQELETQSFGKLASVQGALPSMGHRSCRYDFSLTWRSLSEGSQGPQVPGG